MDLENLKTSFHVGERNVYTRVESARTNESPGDKEGRWGEGGRKERRKQGRGKAETGKVGEKKVLQLS